MDARNHKVRNIIVGAVAALAVGGGAGTAVLAHAADPTASPTPSASSSASQSPSEQQGQQGQPGQGEPGEHGGPRGGHGPGGLLEGDEARAVAEKLGIDQTTLTDAAKAVADELRPTEPPAQGSTRPDPEAMKEEFTTKLAEKLGVHKTALSSAIDEARAAAEATHKAEHRTELEQRLAKAVTAGTITQADADSVLEAFDAGVLGGR